MTKARKQIETVCLQCNKLFLADLREVNRGNAKFCDRKCFGKHHSAKLHAKYEAKNTPNVKCAYCQCAFYKNASEQTNSKHGVFFCCRKHKDLALRKESGITTVLPNHYKQNEIRAYRYFCLRNLEIQACEHCGYNKVPQILEVHHKDRNRQNNKLENLIALCPNCHMEEHFQNKDGKWKKKVQ